MVFTNIYTQDGKVKRASKGPQMALAEIGHVYAENAKMAQFKRKK